MTRSCLRLITVALVSLPTRLAALQQVTEQEPNNSISVATRVQLGDTVSGAIAFGDEDFFAVDLAAGTKLQVVILSGQFCHGFYLLDPNGQFLATGDCFNDNGLRDTINYQPTTAGRYYFGIFHEDETPGDANHPPLDYRVSVTRYQPPPGGLGNPMQRIASGLDGIDAWVATPSGDVIAAQYPVDHDQLVRITPEGQVTMFDPRVPRMNGWGGSIAQMAIDGFGDLLVAACGVWRYSLTTGERTQFLPCGTTEYGYWAIAVGADGDVWLSELVGGVQGASVLSRFDAFGRLKEKVTVPGLGIMRMTVSQDGEIWFVGPYPNNIYRLVDNKTRQLIVAASDQWHPFGSVALDQDRWIYAIQALQQRLLAYDPQANLVRNPLAQINDSLGWARRMMSVAGPLWLRDGDGNMTDRMWVGMYEAADNRVKMRILEVNHRGMGAPGADPMLHVAQKKLRAGAAGSPYSDTLQLRHGSSSNWTVVEGSLPPGLSLSSSGVVSGTPTVQGDAKFTVRAGDGKRAGFGRFTMNVGAAQVATMQIDRSPLRTGALGAAYADTLRVTNAPSTVTWALSSGRLPPGVALTSSSGVLAGTPTDTGTFAFTITATSGAQSGSAQFTILVTPVPIATDDIVSALFGEKTLAPVIIDFLDLHGNHNGRLDVGDLRAFLRARGVFQP